MTVLVTIVVVTLALALIGQFRRALEGSLPKHAQSQPHPEHPFSVPMDRTYIPANVHATIRPMDEEERSIQRKLVGAFSPFKRDEEVTVLRMKVFEAWYLNQCGPDCCPPHIILKIGEQDYVFIDAILYSQGLTFYTDESETLPPFQEHIEIVRTVKTHLPLRLTQSGESVVCHNRRWDRPLDFSSFEGFHCDFFRVDQLPLAFTRAFDDDVFPTA